MIEKFLPYKLIKSEIRFNFVNQATRLWNTFYLISSRLPVKGGSRQVLALEELVSLRNRYGISVAAAVHRAKDLGIISEVYYNDLFNHHIHANRMEEGWGCYPIEEHTDRFERLLHRCVAEGFLSVEKAASLLKPNFRKRMQSEHYQ